MAFACGSNKVISKSKLPWAGRTTRSALTAPSAGIGPWSAALSPSVGGTPVPPSPYLPASPFQSTFRSPLLPPLKKKSSLLAHSSVGQSLCASSAPGFSPGFYSTASGARGRHCPRVARFNNCLTRSGKAIPLISTSSFDPSQQTTDKYKQIESAGCKLMAGEIDESAAACCVECGPVKRTGRVVSNHTRYKITHTSADDFAGCRKRLNSASDRRNRA